MRGTRTFAALAADAYGNAARATFAWRVLPDELGTIAARPAGSALFTAARRLGPGRVMVTVAGSAGQAATAAVTVVPAQLRTTTVLERRALGVRVTVRAVDGARRPVSATRVRLDVKLAGRHYTTVRAVTGAAGAARVVVRGGAACYTVRVLGAQALGFVWDGRGRPQRICP